MTDNANATDADISTQRFLNDLDDCLNCLEEFLSGWSFNEDEETLDAIKRIRADVANNRIAVRS